MQPSLEIIAKNLADIGAISFEDYLQGHSLGPQSSHSEPVGEGNAVTRLHQACQRVFRNTDPLRFEFIEHASNKQCILTIMKPDGATRSYASQPIFTKKNEAKLEAAKIAVDMGALEFLANGPIPDLSPETSSADDTAPSDAISVQGMSVEDIEQCCLEWRAGRVSPRWVPFSEHKFPYKQGCALCIQLSPHVARVYLSDPTFDTHSDAKEACARAAVSEGVLDFIKFGNGQTRPSSPAPPIPFASQSPPITLTTPWTLQAFYDSLPRPFPESFQTHDPSEINALGWMNNLIQNARGGKLILSFFFTSDGPPGLHGCLLKLDRPGGYKASLVDARFPKRSDAKAAACLQAMSEGIGDYIRSITSAVENKVTPTMRSFSSSLVYPALTSALSKIDPDLRPHFEYDKERDAFGGTIVVKLSTLAPPGQVRRYTVSNDYRSKADAKTAVICHAAELGVVEFIRFRGEPSPDGYVTPYSLRIYNPEASRKRKQSGSAEDAEQGQPAKKKRKGKRRAETVCHGGISLLPGQYPSVHTSDDRIHGISGPSDTGPLQTVRCDPPQIGVGRGSGLGVARPVIGGHAQVYVSPYRPVPDRKFWEVGGSGSRGSDPHLLTRVYDGSSRAMDTMPPESGPSRTQPGSSSRPPRRPTEDEELEPGEVVSSAESEFSVSSSRHEDDEMTGNEPEIDPHVDKMKRESTDEGSIAGSSHDKGKTKETSPTNTSTTTSQGGPGSATTIARTATATSHVKNLTDYCARHGCGVPSFHELQNQGRFQVWIVIGKERFDLPATYRTAEEGRQRVAKQVLARLSKGSSS